MDCEIEELWRRCKFPSGNIKGWSNISNKVQFAKDICGSKIDEHATSKVWDPRRLKTTVKEQCSKARRALQYQVWDPEAMKQLKTCDYEVIKYFTRGF